eukprot:CAMPEP_0197913912 /NCGR_PEP_ID=MMETSP1439-20131203/77470_1 /TAXON_ID=66791 /ORGANISM="Gonyaulax spinifera, Strain CCMP409" /LENGTH=33 /DNA_ID= /DNA_START= /DNA_END= /DNA_ORIENTATION=
MSPRRRLSDLVMLGVSLVKNCKAITLATMPNTK